MSKKIISSSAGTEFISVCVLKMFIKKKHNNQLSIINYEYVFPDEEQIPTTNNIPLEKRINKYLHFLSQAKKAYIKCVGLIVIA